MTPATAGLAGYLAAAAVVSLFRPVDPADFALWAAVAGLASSCLPKGFAMLDLIKRFSTVIAFLEAHKAEVESVVAAAEALASHVPNAPAKGQNQEAGA